MFAFEKESVNRITKKLKRMLGKELVTVIAFGSRVRGDFVEESDFDILIVVKKRTFAIIDTINHLFMNEEETAGIPFSVIVKAADLFEKEKTYKTIFYRNITEEGLILHGRA
jgi:predicted nucleotidyltransferase